MAQLGSPRTDKYSIGTAELRLGPLTAAMKLTQAESVGLIDNANVEVAQESVDLEGGFPKILVDTAVIKQTASITSTLREYSRRNLQVLLGEGVVATGSDPVDVSTTVDTAANSGETTVGVDDDAGFGDTDLIVIFGQNNPENVTIARISGAPSPGLITLDANTPLLHNIATGDVVYLANQVAIGAIGKTNYFAVQVIQAERSTARPVGFDFWKAAIGAGMTFATNADDFASTELSLKLLQPALIEYGVGGALEHLTDIIPGHPTGLMFGGGDV